MDIAKIHSSSTNPADGSKIIHEQSSSNGYASLVGASSTSRSFRGSPMTWDEFVPGCILWIRKRADLEYTNNASLKCINEGCDNRLEGSALEHPCLVLKVHSPYSVPTIDDLECTIATITTKTGSKRLEIVQGYSNLEENEDNENLLFLENNKSLREQSYLLAGIELVCHRHIYRVPVRLIDRMVGTHNGLDYRLTKRSYGKAIECTYCEPDRYDPTHLLKREQTERRNRIKKEYILKSDSWQQQKSWLNKEKISDNGYVAPKPLQGKD